MRTFLAPCLSITYVQRHLQDNIEAATKGKGEGSNHAFMDLTVYFTFTLVCALLSSAQFQTISILLTYINPLLIHKLWNTALMHSSNAARTIVFSLPAAALAIGRDVVMHACACISMGVASVLTKGRCFTAMKGGTVSLRLLLSLSLAEGI